VDTLYESPCSTFVAGFVGDCNQLPAVVESARSGNCVVRLPDNSPLTALNVHDLGAGSPCIVAIRPERLHIAANGVSNAIAATALDTVYFGDHVRLRCQIGDHASVFVKLPLRDGASINTIDPGNTIFLQALPQHVRAFRP
jgi:putative spermidine/putrescine transport system ATP-binding protein